MGKIKSGWSTGLLELISVLAGILLFLSHPPLFALSLLALLSYLLARRRSRLWPFVLTFTLLLLVRGALERSAQREGGTGLAGGQAAKTQELSRILEERIAADEAILMSTAKRIVEEGTERTEYLEGALPFGLIEGAGKPGGGRRGLVLFDRDLAWVAWDGEVRGVSMQFLRQAMERGPQAAIEKGAVFTLLLLATPLTGQGEAPPGVLFLCDVLSVERHLGGVGLLGSGFIDGLGGGLADAGMLVGSEEGRAGGGGIPVRSFGQDIAVLLPAEREVLNTVASQAWGWEKWLLPLALVAPLFIVLGKTLRKIDASCVPGMKASRMPYLWLLFWAAVSGLLFLGARVALVAMEVPGSFFETAIFSPNLFASEFLDAGSGSIGDFLVSCLFIFTWTLGVVVRARRLARERGRTASPFGRIACAVSGLLLAGISPFVLMRLLKETSGELLIYGRPMESVAFACWEGSLFLLALSALSLSASLLAISGVGPRRAPHSFLVSLCFSLVLLLLVVLRPGWDLRESFRILLPFAFASVSFLLSGLPQAARSVPREMRLLTVTAAGILLTSLLIFPVILWSRYRVLVEDAEELYTVAEKPIDTWVTFLLEEFIQTVEARQDEIREQLPSRETAFALWAQSPLSRAGTASAISIYGGEGTSLAAFSLLAEPLPTEVVELLWQEVAMRQESFIYTYTVAGEEYYIATVPLEDQGAPNGMVTARLPTGLGRRRGPGMTPFLTGQGTLPPSGRMSFSLLTETEREAWAERGIAEGREWRNVGGPAPGERGMLASLRYVESEGRWLLVQIPLVRRGVVLGMLVATVLLNGLWVFPSFVMLLLFTGWQWRRERTPRRAILASFRARLSAALFVFSFVPTLLWGLLARGTIVERIDRETIAEAQRILRDANLLLGPLEELQEVLPFPSDERVTELAGMIEAELFLYSGHMLVASSRPDLVQSGILLPWMSPRAYRALFLEASDTADDFLTLGPDRYMMVYRKLEGTEPGAALVLATPMLVRQEEIREEVIELDYLLLIAFVSILGASVLMGYLVALFLTKPLGELVKGTSRIASGEFGYQLPESRTDEFGELFESFNEMARKLRTSHAMLLSEKAKLESILKNVDAGVIVVNDQRQVVHQNDAASRIIGKDLSLLLGRDLLSTPIAEGSWREFAVWAATPSLSGEKQFSVATARGDLTVRTAKSTARLTDTESLTVVIFEDITESVRSQRVLAWALMARQIAHEIKNPLTPIRLAVQHIRRLFRDRVPDFGERLEENVDLVLREIDRLGKTASQFSSFAKAESARPVRLDPVPLIQETISLYRGDESGRRIRFEEEKKRLQVLADEEGFRKILVNLIENSRDAIADEGTISISLEEHGEWVALSVRDTGEGIPPGVLGRVFEPDFTTRTYGTGLGLTIVRRITEAWGGRVEITSAPGEGTCVRIFVKRA